jgi:hypothetical protein
MSSNIARRALSAALATRPVSRATTKAVAQAVEQESARAVVQAARVQGAAYLAHTGQALVAALTDEEALYIQRNPHAAHRFMAINDAFAGLVTRAVLQFGMDE